MLYAGSAYMIPTEESQYPHVEPISTNNMMHHPVQQMEPAAKEILNNIENSCSDVNSYLNMSSSSMSCSSNASNMEVNTPTNVIDVAAACEEATPNLVQEQPSPVVNGEVPELAGNLNVNANADASNESISNESIDNSGNSFDMQLFETEENIAAINPQELHKTINSSNVSNKNTYFTHFTCTFISLKYLFS